MKKINLIKINAFLLFVMFVVQAQAQLVDGTRYTMQNKGTSKFLSAVDASTSTYVPVDAADTELQAFTFTTVDHTNGSGVTTTGLWTIDTDVRGILRISGAGAVIHTTKAPGAVTITSDGDKKASIELVSGNEYTVKLSGKFLTDLGNGTYEGTASQSGDSSVWIIQTAPTLSTKKLDVSSIFISNPVHNKLNIEGLNADINQISLYSLLGKELVTKTVNTKESISIDVSGLTSGVYLVKLQGENGVFTKKIVK